MIQLWGFNPTAGNFLIDTVSFTDVRAPGLPGGAAESCLPAGFQRRGAVGPAIWRILWLPGWLVGTTGARACPDSPGDQPFRANQVIRQTPKACLRAFGLASTHASPETSRTGESRACLNAFGTTGAYGELGGQGRPRHTAPRIPPDTSGNRHIALTTTYWHQAYQPMIPFSIYYRCMPIACECKGSFPESDGS